MIDIEAIKKRDAATCDTWFTGPNSGPAQAYRDRRALLEVCIATPGATPAGEDSVRQTAESSRPQELLSSKELADAGERRFMEVEPTAYRISHSGGKVFFFVTPASKSHALKQLRDDGIVDYTAEPIYARAELKAAPPQSAAAAGNALVDEIVKCYTEPSEKAGEQL